MSKFYDIEPSLENYWHSIILFGCNVASYKIALAKALYDLKDNGNPVITLDKLAVPFSKHIYLICWLVHSLVVKFNYLIYDKSFQTQKVKVE